MTTTLTIPKNPVYPTSMDWVALRREGIQHIERLGAQIWTDYNLHDPGITILEILCYAITDLGYRTNLDPKDLFASRSDGAFFTAQQILPMQAVTALDYRKLLVDIPGVKNAWVEQTDEAAVQFYFNTGQLKERLSAHLEKMGVDFSFPEAFDEWLNDLYDCDRKKRAEAIEQLKATFPDEALQDALMKAFDMTAVEDSDATHLFLPQGIYQITLDVEDAAQTEDDDLKREALSLLRKHRNLGEDVQVAVKIVEKKDVGIELDLLLDPSKDEYEVLTAVYFAIHHYLIPDVPFYSLEQMLNKYATFSLDAKTITDLQAVFIPDAIIKVLEPFVGKEWIGITNFQTALKKELTAEDWMEYGDTIFVKSKKQYNSDQVYQGPLLRHGFIDEQELLAAQPRQTVYRSDLYQLIAAVEGVEEIKKLQIFKIEEDLSIEKKNDENSNETKWCLAFDCRCLPRLDLSVSTISIDKGAGKVPIDTEELMLHVEVNPPLTTKINRSDELDLPMPEGTVYEDLSDFTSIQQDFPRTYQIGKTGISSKETSSRKARAKQLQAYLLFYDQIFANYLSHLSNVRQLLALDAKEGKSFQPLYDIPGIQNLLIDFDGEDWDAFQSDEKNKYISALAQLSKKSDTAHRLQKNKVLDHLLGRFGEQFTDYVLRLYQIEQPVNRNAVLEGNLKDWTIDKQRLLDFIPQLSSGRGAGFDYRPSDGSGLWKIDQEKTYSSNELQLQLQGVSGLKKRVCAHLGIEDWTRHTITCQPNFQVRKIASRSVGRARSSRKKYLIVVENEAEILLMSTRQFGSDTGANNAIEDFNRHAADLNRYEIVDDRVGFWLEENKTLDNAFLLDPKRESETALTRLRQLQEMASGNCQSDNFHIIEHILLRPKSELYTELLQPMLGSIDCLKQFDPYSFWLTVVVPAWVDRFKDVQQRHLFEQRLRMEAPAHLMLNIVSLEREAMLHFENNYHQWLIASCEQNEDQLPKLTNELVLKMNSWQ